MCARAISGGTNAITAQLKVIGIGCLLKQSDANRETIEQRDSVRSNMGTDPRPHKNKQL